MTHLIGVEHRERFTVLDSSGDLVEGETFVADQTIGPDGNTFAFTVEGLGSGLYEVVYTPALSGTYYLRLVTDTILTSPPLVYEFQDNDDDAEAGEDLTIYFTILDDDGAYYDDAIFTVQFALGPNGGTFVPIIVSLGLGLYRITWTSSVEGVYSLRFTADLSAIGDDTQIFAFERRVEPVVLEESPFVSEVGTALEDIIRATALRCRDYLDTMATADAADGQTWPDTQTMAARSPKDFMGANLFVVAASFDDNVGREVRIIDSTETGLVLSPPLPSPPRRGDMAYITNLASQGFFRQTYLNEINANLVGSFPNYAVPLEWTFSDPLFSGDLPYLVPPADFTHLYSVSYPQAGWSPYDVYIPFADENTSGWWWDRAGNRIVINGGYRAQASGVPVTIKGFGRPRKLVIGTEQTGIDLQWIVAQSAGNLVWAIRDPKRAAEAANSINRADSYLLKTLTQYPPGTVRIR